MTTEQKSAFLQYEEYKIQAKDLDKKMDALKPIMLPAIELGQKLPGEYGTFELNERATWKYSPETTAEQDKVDALKADEVARGIATKKATQFIKYNPNKESKDALAD